MQGCWSVEERNPQIGFRNIFVVTMQTSVPEVNTIQTIGMLGR